MNIKLKSSEIPTSSWNFKYVTIMAANKTGKQRENYTFTQVGALVLSVVEFITPFHSKPTSNSKDEEIFLFQVVLQGKTKAWCFQTSHYSCERPHSDSYKPDNQEARLETTRISHVSPWLLFSQFQFVLSIFSMIINQYFTHYYQPL